MSGRNTGEGMVDPRVRSVPAPPDSSSAEAPTDGSGVLEFAGICHTYRTANRSTHVLNDVSFAVPAATVACVVGPSGCGKSTLLSLAAGLLRARSGEVRWDGRAVALGPNDALGMAFQQPGLFPWMNVRANVAIGPITRGRTHSEAGRIADRFLETVGLTEFAGAYPSQLSGGMAQRVGIARALALEPRLLLLDEPFAAVDAFTRLKLQHELKQLLAQSRATVLFVTHDVSEAIVLGDKVIAMSQRPASVLRSIPIEPGDRNRAGAAYARRLAEILACLGVPADEDHP